VHLEKSGRLNRYLTGFGILLVVTALLAGMAGCSHISRDVEVRTWYDLDAVRDNLAGHHLLMNDLNSTTAGYEELASPTANGGKGWDPIGYVIYEGGPIFKGTFDGQGYEIHDLYINRPGERYVGLFGCVFSPGLIQDIGVVNVTVIGGDSVGGLMGSGDTVSNCYSTGSVTGNKYVGGLTGGCVIVSNSYSIGSVTGNKYVGGLAGGAGISVSNSHAIGDVTGIEDVGGLVGHNEGTVDNSYSTGRVTGESEVGGLVGYNLGTVSDSYSTSSVSGVTGGVDVGGLAGYSSGNVSYCHSVGSVTGDEYVGGLVGYNDGPVSDSYSTGSAAGNSLVGGLVGRNYDTVCDSYSTGSVAGNSLVGGLVGWNHGSVSDSYSTGSAVGNEHVGGLVGFNYPGTVGNSFWDIESSGQSTSAGGTGMNTTQMQDIVTFSNAGWNIVALALNETNSSYIWNIVNNVTYPFLSWQVT
jgi:hypothetical protein